MENGRHNEITEINDMIMLKIWRYNLPDLLM